MPTEFDDSQHYGIFLTNPNVLDSNTTMRVRHSELTLAALRAGGILDNVIDGVSPPALDKLWLDKNFDPAVLKEWDSIGSNWAPVTFKRMFERASVTVLDLTGGTADDLVVDQPENFIPSRLYSIVPTAANTGAVTITVAGVGEFDATYPDGSALDADELFPGRQSVFVFDNGRFELLFGWAATIRAEAARDIVLDALSTVTAPKGTLALAIADSPAINPAFYDVAYFDMSTQSGSGARYRKVASEPSHPGKFRNHNGTGAWYEMDDETLRPQQFGECNTADDYAVFQKWAQTTVALKRAWRIPSGTYVLNGDGPIYLKTSGFSQGRIEIPKSNHTCRFEITRDALGSVVDLSTWDSVSRGKEDISAFNCAGKNVVLVSTETLIQRDGSGGSPYLKQEVLRIPGNNGRASSGAVCTYTSNANLTVTAHTPSEPIEIKGLRIRRTGTTSGTETFRGCIVVSRDNVTLKTPGIINEDLADALSVGIEVSFCADVVIEEPFIRGFRYNGLGYGIIFGTTIGCVVRGGSITDCRHSISGRHNVDLHVYGGNHSYQIDDHWGDRMVIKDVTVHCLPGMGAIEFAGNDIDVINLKQFGGRNTLGIRVDTPNLGGKVRIISPTIDTRGEAGFFYLFGFTSPNGPNPAATWTTNPTLPDEVIIEDMALSSSTSFSYIVHAGGAFTSQHVNWGTISVRGHCRSNGLLFGVFYRKDSRYQHSRRTLIEVDGLMDFNGGQAVYAEAFDSVTTQAARVEVRNLRNGDLRLRPYAVETLIVEGGAIGSIFKDGSEGPGSSLFIIRSARMVGGSVNAAWENMAFFDCVFTGNYTAFPPAAEVTMVGNTRLGVTGLPTDIRANIVSPFA